LYNQKLELVYELPKNEDYIENQKINLIIESENEAYCLSNADDLFEAFFHSFRSHADLTLSLRNQENYQMDIVLREWNSKVKPQHEFRCFVFNNQMNAITQYFFAGYYQEILENKEKIENQIQTFFKDEIQGKLKELKNYVIDFAVIPENGITLVIELNPFTETTGTNLFSWFWDAKIIYEGYEFRILKEPCCGFAYSVIDKELVDCMKQSTLKFT
jgi:hypothetical protein